MAEILANKEKYYFMNSKKILIIILVILALAGAYFFYKQSTSGIDKQRQIAQMTEFVVKDEALTEDLADKYSGKFETAKNLFLARGDIIDSVRPLIDMGVYKQLVGDYQGAELIWLYGLELAPTSHVLNGNLAHLYQFWLEDYETAEGYYLKALAIDAPNRYTFFSELYELYRYRLEDEVKTKAILVTAIDTLPENINAYALSAKYYKDTGDKEKAREFYNKMLEINPDSIVGNQGLDSLNN